MEHFRTKGIQVEYTIRYTPQQNGVAERMNRTIIEKARYMILHSKLNKNFWSEAVLSAVYIINRSPTAALKNLVPAELWFGKKPDVRKLKVFGCVAHLHIPKELNPRKFDSRSTKCIMISYTNNGYRLWSLEDQRIISGRDVIFDETKFLTNIQQPYVETSISEDSNSNLSAEQDETDQYETAPDHQEPNYPSDKLISTEKNKLETSIKKI
ncbi:Copia protein [Trachymyrmex zeteki]|uniref:Copia protein n=1 Tax=Mycetomoellerius zeteki TaxID=64791 RepID=A0A151X5X1_9HYME|nr:Copia protein [Trachymyrmex zeteki]